MKLFLASSISSTTDICIETFQLEKNKNSITYIPTAGNIGDYSMAIAQRESYLCWKKRGFSVEVLYLENTSQSEMENSIRENSVIMMAGGNTFFLLYHVLKSGYLSYIEKHVKSGGIYVGSSAGSVICSPDISYVAYFDDPKMAPELKDYSGFGFVDAEIYPHYGMGDMQDSYSADHLKKIFLNDEKRIILSDTQALLVDNNMYRIVK